MKFNVGDLLIDNGNTGDDILREAVVVDMVTGEGEGTFAGFGEGCYYTLQYSNGEVEDFAPQIAEFMWQVAPKGSVAWLIHQLSALPQLAPTYYFQWDDVNRAFVPEPIEGVEYKDNWERVELW